MNRFSENWKSTKNLYPNYKVEYELIGNYKTGRDKYCANIFDKDGVLIAKHDAMKLKSSKGVEYYMVNKNKTEEQLKGPTKYDKMCEYLTSLKTIEDINLNTVFTILDENIRSV